VSQRQGVNVEKQDVVQKSLPRKHLNWQRLANSGQGSPQQAWR